MLKLIWKWLKVHEDEFDLFFWSAIILFLIRISSIVFNNFAETAFLKRYGVEYLPVVMMVNSIATFLIMGAFTGIMARLPGSRLLSYLLVYCGVSVAALRFVIPLNFDLIYPVLYIMKAQYEVLLAMVFWNLANDLFNTRQSKRLFPLITAGGVIGGILGSFATPSLAKAISIDNLMFVYLVTTLICAFLVKRMGIKFPYLLFTDSNIKKTRKKSSVVDEFKKIIPIIKESTLVKILILLTFFPNVVIPILNYQFNFTVNQQFVSQSDMLAFFGYFRGSMNVISLVILLFVGRAYGKLRIPVILLFHPINYCIVFLALLFKLDIISVMYARVSTNIMRTVMNIPSRAVLMGLFPASYRAVIRPFLRGIVVRIGILLGTGIIMVAEGLFAPRYLSIIALIFVAGWIGSGFLLKKRYAGILLDLVSKNMIDLKSMEREDVDSVFRDKRVQSQLLESFRSAIGDDKLWYASLLKRQNISDFDQQLLSVLKEQDGKTRGGLLDMVSSKAGDRAIPIFRELCDMKDPMLMEAIIRTSYRISPDSSLGFSRDIFEKSPNPEVRAYALRVLYPHSPSSYQEVIKNWLASDDLNKRRAGVIAIGASKDQAYIPMLKEILSEESDATIVSQCLDGLKELCTSEINTIAIPYLNHVSELVRNEALNVLEITDDQILRQVIGMMNDTSEEICRLAREKIHDSTYQNSQVLVESLTIPRRKVREGIFALLDTLLHISGVDIFKFVRAQLEMSYMCLAEIEGLKHLPEGVERGLLIDHLDQRRILYMENSLRVLVAEDRSGSMRIVWRGLFSADTRQRSNSIETLDDIVDPGLSKIMIPLLEDAVLPECLAMGRRQFALPVFGSDQAALYRHLLDKDEWLTVVLTLYLVSKQNTDQLDKSLLEGIDRLSYPNTVMMARRVLAQGFVQKEGVMEPEISIPDKILHLRKIQIFEALSVSELAAIASVTEEVGYPVGQEVIKEGELGDTMYFIIKGEVSVLKGQEDGGEIELDRTRSGDYFGEMALFDDDVVRSVTIRIMEESRMLVLHKKEFKEIVRKYPEIALEICKVLGQRIRKLSQKVQA